MYARAHTHTHTHTHTHADTTKYASLCLAPQIGQVFAAREQYSAAINTYMEALEHSPESPELLTSLGLLLLRVGDSQRAFDQLGTSLLHDPRSARTIMAVGSIIQVCAPAEHRHPPNSGALQCTVHAQAQSQAHPTWLHGPTVTGKALHPAVMYLAFARPAAATL